jgi:RNA polymerase sigma factor (TIGR02999 family)
MASSCGDITQLLHRIASGDRSAEPELVPKVYLELRKVAARFLRRERTGHTLEPTDLVHEAYLKLTGQRAPGWKDRAHFFGIAAHLMRQILVDYARRQKAEKRGGSGIKVPLEGALLANSQECQLVSDLDSALERLATMDPRQAKVVEMRFFAGLNEEEIAAVLGVSVRTVKRDWMSARAWLHGILTS